MAPSLNATSDAPNYQELIVGVADMKMALGETSVLSTYALGSCLGITLYDAERKIGGLLHAMLPDSRLHHGQATKIAMFLDSGLEGLLGEMRKQGCQEGELECKVFGGSQVISADKYFRIGDRNIQTFRELSQKLGLRVAIWEVGGQMNRTIKFYLESGQVSVRTPSQPLFWR